MWLTVVGIQWDIYWRTVFVISGKTIVDRENKSNYEDGISYDFRVQKVLFLDLEVKVSVGGLLWIYYSIFKD